MAELERKVPVSIVELMAELERKICPEAVQSLPNAPFLPKIVAGQRQNENDDALIMNYPLIVYEPSLKVDTLRIAALQEAVARIFPPQKIPPQITTPKSNAARVVKPRATFPRTTVLRVVMPRAVRSRVLPRQMALAASGAPYPHADLVTRHLRTYA